MSEEEKKDETQTDDLKLDIGMNPEELPDELKPMYKSMQADYTRKTQALAEERKGFDSTLSERQTEYEEKLKTYGSMEQEVNQWRNWYQNERKEESGTDVTDTSTDTGVDYESEPGETRYNALIAQNKELEAKIAGIAETQKRSNAEVGRMFKYQDQLGELKSENPEMDKQKVIDHMLAQGITEPSVAFKEIYQEDIIEARVAKQVEERMAELKEKHNADVLTGAGSKLSPFGYTPPKDMKPKNWEDAEQEVLREHMSKELGITS